MLFNITNKISAGYRSLLYLPRNLFKSFNKMFVFANMLGFLTVNLCDIKLHIFNSSEKLTVKLKFKQN